MSEYNSGPKLSTEINKLNRINSIYSIDKDSKEYLDTIRDTDESNVEYTPDLKNNKASDSKSYVGGYS